MPNKNDLYSQLTFMGKPMEFSQGNSPTLYGAGNYAPTYMEKAKPEPPPAPESFSVSALDSHPLALMLTGQVVGVDVMMGDGAIILNFAGGKMVSIGIDPAAGGLKIQEEQAAPQKEG